MSAPVLTEVSTLGDLLLRAAAKEPSRTALVLPGVEISYAALHEGATNVARALIGLGVAPGDHVALLIPNCVEFAEAFFGIALAGAVAVPLNARHRAAELGYIIENASAVAVLTSSDPSDPVDFLGVLREAMPSLRQDGGIDAPGCHIAFLRGEGDGRILGRTEFLAAGSGVAIGEVEQLRRQVRVRGPALIIYTSGTTANPKGCVLTHEAITRGPVERARYRLSTGGIEVTWSPGPLFHIASLAPFIGSVGVVGTFLTDSYFEPGRALALLYEHRATLAWPWFSAVVQGLLDHPQFDSAKLNSLRYLFLIAPPTLVDRVQDELPQAEVIQACGMSETAGIFALCDADEGRASRSTTNGKASPGVELRIVDPNTGLDLPDGTMGEIWVRGYNVMEEYWAAPDKTREAMTEDRWLRTGDLYTRLPNGSVIFGGRYKDMLKVGGENVAAIEVEAFLCTHPDVKIAEVVGRADPRLDEVAVAFVELRAGATVTEAALIDHCKGRIASYKVPRAVHFMAPADWPMSATKVDKRALRERLK